MQLILGSSSPARHQQLTQLGVEFICVAPEIDEAALPDESAAELVERLSIAKAKKVAMHSNDAVIIAGDLVGVNDEVILGKPHTFENAVQQLLAASGKTLTFYSGICVLNSLTQQYDVAVELTHTTFRQLTLTDIEAYIKQTQPLNCAGSFHVEGLGIALFEKIVSNDPTALTGLPLIHLTTLLNKQGINVLSKV